MGDRNRIIELQRQVCIAKRALEMVAAGVINPESRAENALEAMRPLDLKQPLQGLLGHERRSRHDR